MNPFHRIIPLCYLMIALFTVTSLQAGDGLTATGRSPHAQFAGVPMQDVRWTEGFWADRFALCEEVMIPRMREQFMERALDNFRATAKDDGTGEFFGTWWMDGDFYKWFEAMAWMYGITGDAGLDRQMDEIIAILAKAQMDDGYLDTPIQLKRGELASTSPRKKILPPTERWTESRPHEVYNFGHMITAACVHYRATGKRNFLDIAVKAADHLETVFGDPKPELDLINYNPPHIMGLVELYRTTDEQRYLQLAQTILDMRGTSRQGSDHNQSRVPFRKVNHATGHAVLGTYLYAGAADLYLESGESAVGQALERLWQDVTGKRMYVTGGCTAIHHARSQQFHDPVHEAFGMDYELHNATAYNETCANIGNAMWNWRMLTATGDARFADVMELVWYNSLLSAISLTGDNYFYTNVLRWHGDDHKLLSNDAPERWSNLDRCICCPPNIVRTIAEMNAYAYGVADDALWVHLYGGNTLDTALPGGKRIALRQETDYPWDGSVKLTVEQAPDADYTLKLRIPGWGAGATLMVNGVAIDRRVQSGKYLDVTRRWKAGDEVQLNLPMRVRLMEGNPKIEEVRRQAAVKRGPLVYCLESTDLPDDVDILDVTLPVRHQLQPKFRKNLLGGVTTLQGDALVYDSENWDGLYREVTPQAPRRVPVTLIPYYAWCNRGKCEMTVFMPLER
jgi:uncharacterized protein